MTLTQKQQRFVEAYCGEARFNASEAARLAGYSEKSAPGQGHENLQKPHIQSAIKDLLRSRVGDDARVLAEIASLAFGLEYEPKDRLKALDMLARHMGLYNDKKTITHNVTDGASLKEAAAQLLGFTGEAGGDEAGGLSDANPVDLEDA